MKLDKYLKKFHRIALVKSGKHGVGLAGNLLSSSLVGENRPDLFLFVEADVNYMELTLKESLVMVDHCFMNAKKIDHLELDPSHCEDGDLNGLLGDVYTADLLLAAEGRLKKVRAVVVFDSFAQFVNEYLLPNGIKTKYVSWMDYGMGSEKDVPCLSNNLESLGVRYLLELQSHHDPLPSEDQCHSFTNQGIVKTGAQYDNYDAVLWKTDVDE